MLFTVVKFFSAILKRVSPGLGKAYQPDMLYSVSCLSYNKRSNWSDDSFLGLSTSVSKTISYPLVAAFVLEGWTFAFVSQNRLNKKSSLVCFAGLESPPNQSGAVDRKSREVSKKGSPHFRKALFQVMDCLIKHSPINEPVYRFLDRKRAEDKHYYCYMTAGSAKFLHIYYARVKEYLDTYYPA